MLRLILILSLCVLPSCSGLEAYSAWDEAADFSAYRSFALESHFARFSTDPNAYTEVVGESIRKAISETLTARGYEKVDESIADFVVTYAVESEPVHGVVRDRVPAYHHGWFRFGEKGSEVTSVHRVEGTLVIDVVDRTHGKFVWRGWSSAELLVNRDHEDTAMDAVRAILALFPPVSS